MKATYRPSALIDGSEEPHSPVAFGPAGTWLTSRVVPVTRSCRKMSESKLLSTCPGTRLVDSLAKTTYLPSALTVCRASPQVLAGKVLSEPPVSETCPGRTRDTSSMRSAARAGYPDDSMNRQAAAAARRSPRG